MEIQLDEAIELIEEKEKKDREKIIKTFEEEPELQVLNGRYGPYIAYKKSNYKIPKSRKPEELSLEDCRKIIAETDKGKDPKVAKDAAKDTAAKGTTTKSAAKKTTASKTSVKKPAAKKATTKK